jgi:ribose-phosphate pyrophosphokinase
MIYNLNLDKDFYSSFYEINFEIFQFSGGEWHIKLDNTFDYSKVDKVIIRNRIKNSDDIIKILIAKDALERKGIKNFELLMPYIPYARQDRQCIDGESFSLKVFANLINSLNFNKIYVYDAHSDVAPALINNCINISNIEYVKLTIKDINESNILLISPDSGANKKMNKLYDLLNLNYDISLIKCDKKRNTTTGKLSDFEVFTNDLENKSCLIVDDICDGGRTFIGIAKELKKKNAGDIYLFVTHGIFSNGFEELSKYFKKIYCTNSFKDINDSVIEQFKIEL